MALIKSSEDWAVTAEGAARRVGWRAEHELALRKAMEDLLRQRQCDLPFVSGVEDIECQWELDPDILREDQDERRRIEAKDSEP